MPSLPSELLAQILQDVATNQHAPQCLKTLSLVSKDFLHLARAHRYRHIQLELLYGSIISDSNSLELRCQPGLSLVRQPHIGRFVKDISLRLRLADAPEPILTQATQEFDLTLQQCPNVSRLTVTFGYWRAITELPYFASAFSRLALQELSLPRIDETTLEILQHLPMLRQLALDHSGEVTDTAPASPFAFSLQSLTLSNILPLPLFISFIFNSTSTLRHLSLDPNLLILACSALQHHSNIVSLELTNLNGIDMPDLLKTHHTISHFSSLHHLRLTSPPCSETHPPFHLSSFPPALTSHHPIPRRLPSRVRYQRSIHCSIGAPVAPALEGVEFSNGDLG